ARDARLRDALVASGVGHEGDPLLLLSAHDGERGDPAFPVDDHGPRGGRQGHHSFRTRAATPRAIPARSLASTARATDGRYALSAESAVPQRTAGSDTSQRTPRQPAARSRRLHASGSKRFVLPSPRMTRRVSRPRGRNREVSSAWNARP